MSTKYPGGIISKTAPTVSTSSASGIWTLDQAEYYIALGTWPVAPAPHLFGWGAAAQGQLGLGNTTVYSSPKQVGLSNAWSILSAGANSTISIQANGTLWAWGQNNNGQLGLGNRTYYSSPKQVGSLNNWYTVSISNTHTTAIKTDGTLWSWGQSQYGALGLGNTTRYSSPKQVGSLTSWLSIASGNYFTTAIKTDGTLWSWGWSNNGQLGLGNTTSYSSPKQVGALTTWSKIRTNGGSSYTVLAIKTDGTLWAWGKNNGGQLGLGDITNRSSPVQVGALTNWLQVSSNEVSFAVKTDGTLWSWGSNINGDLGLGNTTSYSSPKQVGSLTTWAQVASGGGRNGYAIKTNGTLWAWGNGTSGQLGLGNQTYYSSPKQVGSLTSWSTIAPADNFIVAIASTV